VRVRSAVNGQDSRRVSRWKYTTGTMP